MPTPPNLPTQDSSDDASANTSLYDFESIFSVAGGDQKIIKDLIDGLIQSNLNDLAELDAVLEAQDWLGLAEVAHRLKGSAKIINSQPLLQSCIALEEATRAASFSVAEEKALTLRGLVLLLGEALLER